jgi:hypothetical protein
MSDDDLSRLRPTADQTAFLRAAIGDLEVAAAAWQRWSSRGGPSMNALAPYKELLPLLAWNLERHAIAIDPPVATILRFARLTEKLRAAKYREICGDVFARLRDAGRPFLVLKGAALADRVYPSAELRHSDDVDLLLAPCDVSIAWTALVARGWVAEPRTWPIGRHQPRIFHPSGVPIELHHRLLIDFYRIEFEALWAERQVSSTTGHDVAILSDTDALMHACAHGVSSRAHLRWVPDAWFLITRAQGVNWSALVERTLAARLSVLMVAALSYLNTAIADVVPGEALRPLEAAARRAGREERAAALVGLGPATAPTLRAIWRSGTSWNERMRESRRLVFPPAAAVTAEFGLTIWQVPAYYAVRAGRYLARGCRILAARAQSSIG